MNVKDKKFIILGLGRSGLAAARLLKHFGANVTVADSQNNKKLQERADLLRSEEINVLLGNEADHDPTFYDSAILSPGIEETSILATNVINKKIPLIGELELAYAFCCCPLVAITGSNGKTTTTELTALALQGAGLKTIACGNIGLPFSEAVLQSEHLDVIIVEASSFQLETIHHFHANVAVWLNFTPNHLDRYCSLEKYREAKMRVFRNQTAADITIVPKNFDSTALALMPARQITFSATDSESDFSFSNNIIFYRKQELLAMKDVHLRGAHNAENLMAAFAVGVAFKCDLNLMVKAVADYRPPPHRCELVAIHNGVTWINDSKATTLDAMEKALHSMKEGSSTILIAGGKNKGSSFKSILPLVKQRIKQAILIGEMSDSIIADWSGIHCTKTYSMEEAVIMAGISAKAGDTILLSPGTSSYDMFHDYIERGDSFKKYVQKFIQKLTTT